MKPWDAISETDIQNRWKVTPTTKEDWIKLHTELTKAAVELSEGGDVMGSDEIDNDCIFIEKLLQERYQVEI